MIVNYRWECFIEKSPLLTGQLEGREHKVLIEQVSLGRLGEAAGQVGQLASLGCLVP